MLSREESWSLEKLSKLKNLSSADAKLRFFMLDSADHFLPPIYVQQSD